MAIPATPIIPQDGQIRLRDNTSGTRKSLIIAYEDGDFKITGLVEGMAAQQIFLDRGIPYAGRKGDLQAISFSFSAHAVAFSDSSAGTPMDAILKTGSWSGAVSMLPSSSGDLYLLNVDFAAERSNFGGTADAALDMQYCGLTMDFEEGMPGKFNVSGTAYMFGGMGATPAPISWS